MKLNKKMINGLAALVIAAVAYFFNLQGNADKPHSPSSKAPTTSTQSQHKDESQKLQDAFRQRRSKVWATVPVKVRKTLLDDNEGSRHQRFLVNLNDGQSILVAHNIDLAPRAPIKAGQTIWIRGRYEWSDKGGVLHWTHHDPKKPNRQAEREGWIEVNGKRYE